MKIGILTLPFHINYGGILQNYALQQILIRLGHEPETIDYGWVRPNELKRYMVFLKGFLTYYISHSKNKQPYYPLSKKEDEIISHNMNSFVDKHIKRTRKLYYKQEFEKIAHEKNYDAYIVGSDQCWRPSCNNFLTTMYFDFLSATNDVIRLSYGASFGTDIWEYSKEEEVVCKELLKSFKAISVREASGQQLCKNYFDRDAIHVLDPTLLLEPIDYIQLIKETSNDLSKGDLFEFYLDPSDKKEELMQVVSSKLGYSRYRVLPKYQAENRTCQNVKHHIEDCIYPEIGIWLKSFYDAKMVVVDSFHGMVFSIIFNKPFWVVGNVSRGMSRFKSLLSMLHLEDRLLDLDKITLENFDFNKKIDWNTVNEILEIEKNKSIAFITNSLNKK